RDLLQQYTVLINDLPKDLRTHATLDAYLEALFPGNVDAVHITMECRALEAKVAARKAMLTKLERAMVVNQRKSPPRIKVNAEMVDAIPHYQSQLTELNTAIQLDIEALHTHEAELGESHDAGASQFIPEEAAIAKVMRPTALVTFHSLQATQSALQMVQTTNPLEFNVAPAPHPSDMIWTNLGRTLHVRNSARLACTLVTAAVIFLWTGPTVFVTSLSNVQLWREKSPWLDDLFTTHPQLVPLFKQLSPLGLVAFSVLAPYVFLFIASFEGHASQSEMESSIYTKLVIFHFYQTFVVSLFATSLTSALPTILQQPVEAVHIMSKAVPQQASLYMSYLIIQTGLSLTIRLYRVVAFWCALVYRVCAPRVTPRERRASWFGFTPTSVAEICDQSYQLPHFFLAILFVLVFCPITPILGWCGCILFVLADVVYRRLFFFVFSPAPFTTGVYWPKMYTFIVRGMYVAQIILIGMLWLRVCSDPSG
ncbi:hypothetical protein As57867_006178, partial [Aphanomyces stellatus]